MIRYARIEGGVVAELIDIPEDGVPIGQRFHPDIVAALAPIPAGGAPQLGWGWNAGTFTAPPLPASALPPVPVEISPRQLLLALTGAAIITEAEALAAARTGAVPASIDAIFATLPGPAAFAARVTWARMTVVLRSDPMVAALAASRGMDGAAVDDFFRTAAGL